MSASLLVFGAGYSALPIMETAKDAGWHVYGTYRTAEKKSSLENAGYQPVPFEAATVEKPPEKGALHIIVSIAPTVDGDPTLAHWITWLKLQNDIATISYLSSTNVYGDHKGGWVDETTPAKPVLKRGKYRYSAEQEWQKLAMDCGARLFTFRLAGIYGPTRNAFQALKTGRARCIVKKKQVFGRIHQSDIYQTVWAAMNSSHSGGIFNLADDLPTAPHLVIETAADMLGITPPPQTDFEKAKMSEMARSFYQENKRVKNDKIKKELGITLRYPTYKEGLAALYKTET